MNRNDMRHGSKEKGEAMRKKLASMIVVLMLICNTQPVSAAQSFANAGSNGTRGWSYYYMTTTVHLRKTENGTSLGLCLRGDAMLSSGVSSNQAGGYVWRHGTMQTGQNAGKSGYVANMYTTIHPLY